MALVVVPKHHQCSFRIVQPLRLKSNWYHHLHLLVVWGGAHWIDAVFRSIRCRRGNAGLDALLGSCAQARPCLLGWRKQAVSCILQSLCPCILVLSIVFTPYQNAWSASCVYPNPDIFHIWPRRGGQHPHCHPTAPQLSPHNVIPPRAHRLSVTPHTPHSAPQIKRRGFNSRCDVLISLIYPGTQDQLFIVREGPHHCLRCLQPRPWGGGWLLFGVAHCFGYTPSTPQCQSGPTVGPPDAEDNSLKTKSNNFWFLVIFFFLAEWPRGGWRWGFQKILTGFFNWIEKWPSPGLVSNTVW